MKQKQYFIPHNFRDRGRIMGVIYPKDLAIGSAWGLLMMLLLVIIPFVDVTIKLFVWVIIGLFPGFLLIMGMGDRIQAFWNFKNNRRIYYDVERGQEEAYAYSKLKAERVKLQKKK